MLSDVNLWCLAIYITAFVLAAFKAGQLQWLWASVTLWLGLGMIGARLLPGVWGITHLSAIYMPHFYIAIASVFFFVNTWKKHREEQRWVAEGAGTFISLFAVSGALMSVVSLLMLMMIVWQFPKGVTPYVLPAFLQMYAFKPAYWLSMQAVLMGLFYLHRCTIMHEAANRFSAKQLHIGFLLALLFQVVGVVSGLLEIRY